MMVATKIILMFDFLFFRGEVLWADISLSYVFPFPISFLVLRDSSTCVRLPIAGVMAVNLTV